MYSATPSQHLQYVPTRCEMTRSGLWRFRAARSSGLRIHMGQLSVTDWESAIGTTSVTYKRYGKESIQVWSAPDSVSQETQIRLCALSVH
jgi:hypothetical protein